MGKFLLLSKFNLLVPLLACLGAIMNRERPQSGFKPDLCLPTKPITRTEMQSDCVLRVPMDYQFQSDRQIYEKCCFPDAHVCTTLEHMMSPHLVLGHLLLVVFFGVQIASVFLSTYCLLCENFSLLSLVDEIVGHCYAWCLGTMFGIDVFYFGRIQRIFDLTMYTGYCCGLTIVSAICRLCRLWTVVSDEAYGCAQTTWTKFSCSLRSFGIVNAYTSTNNRKSRCRKVAIGHGSEMRVKRPLCCIQKHRIRSCRSKPKLSSQFKRTSSVPDIVEGCFPNTSPPFEIEFVWVCYVVVNLLWICFCSSIWTNAGFLYSVAAVIWNGIVVTAQHTFFLCTCGTLVFMMLATIKQPPKSSLISFVWVFSLCFLTIPTVSVQAVKFGPPNQSGTSNGFDKDIASTATALVGLGAAALRCMKNVTGNAPGIQAHTNSTETMDSDEDEFAAAKKRLDCEAGDKENVAPVDENTFCSIASSESADDGDFCMKRPQKALKQGESGETTQGPPMPRQEIFSTSESCNPKFGALIVDIEDLQKGQSFQVNSVEEVKSYVKTQANCRNFKASVGKGSGGGKYPVLEMVCSRSGFSAKKCSTSER